MDKIDSRTLPVDAHNERRRRAVKMRLDGGASLKDSAAQCEMLRTTVIAAAKAYEAGGWKAVDVDRGGRPVGSGGRTLGAEQEREVQRLIRDRTPDQLKMIYALWTRQAGWPSSSGTATASSWRFVRLACTWSAGASRRLSLWRGPTSKMACGGAKVARRGVPHHRRLRQGRGSRNPLGR